MKNILLILMVFGIVGCETTSSYGKYQPHPEYEGDAFRYKDLYERYVIPRIQIIGDGFYNCAGKSFEAAEKLCLELCIKESHPSSSCSLYKRGAGKTSEWSSQYLVQTSKNWEDKVDAWRANLIAERERAEKAKQDAIAKRQEEQRAKKLKAEQAKYLAYINTLKSKCVSYGFKGDNAIATCVQREINLEKDRIQQQPIIVQQSSGPNYDALSSMGNCLQNEGSFAACSNAWQGYTPPRKTVTKCRYDAFGNMITGTCTTE